jgi:hypothetical protein
MEQLKTRNWHWRIRINSRVWMYRPGRYPCHANCLSLAAGEAQFWHDVNMTHRHDGPGHLAWARRQDGQEEWLVGSDEPTIVKTFEAYGWRVDIEENFLDDTSNGFQLESSLSRSRGYELVTRVYLPADADPEPAMASKRQYQKQLRRFSALASQDAGA